MKILHDLQDIPKDAGQFQGIGLTIGNFDGVHIGHRALLKKIKTECLAKELLFVVVTFIPHPQKIGDPMSIEFTGVEAWHGHQIAHRPADPHRICVAVPGKRSDAEVVPHTNELSRDAVVYHEAKFAVEMIDELLTPPCVGL